VLGRRVDDNVQILLRYANGARGARWASQVAPGQNNGLRLRVFGEKGALEWSQEEPNRLIWSPLGEPPRWISRGTAAMNAAGQRVNRIPAGHPEGHLEAFATIDPAVTFPTIEDGVAGVAMGRCRPALEQGRRALGDDGAVTTGRRERRSASSLILDRSSRWSNSKPSGCVLQGGSDRE
jgi:predicted dehydrogenase